MGWWHPNGVGLAAYARGPPGRPFGKPAYPGAGEARIRLSGSGRTPRLDAVRERYFDPKERLSINNNIGYAAVSAVDAWRDAGFDVPARDGDAVAWDTGCIIGSGIGGMDTIAEQVVPMVNEGKVRRLGSRIVEQVMNSGTSARIAGLLALGNQVTSNSSACSTGNEAIIEGLLRIRTGLAKRMLVGGSEGASPYIWSGFDAMRVICRKFNDQPERASRPLSASAGGFVPGAGGGVLLVEELESAMERGARIYAEILGDLSTAGGTAQGVP